MSLHEGSTAGTTARPVVLVTGAAGSVGRFVVKHLVEEGFAVRALDLPGADFPPRSRGEVEVMEADITVPGVAKAAVEGAAAVVHAAARVDIGGSWDDLAPVNFNATVRLYDAASAAGVGHFVFVSTGSVYAGGPHYQDENSPVAEANAYVRTKIMSERHLRGSAGPTTVNVMRPALIYGPWGRVLAGALATTPFMLRLFTGRMVTLTGGPISNWVHAEDVARAAVFLVTHPQPHGQVFNVANDDPVSVGDVLSIALKAGGVRLNGARIPYPTFLVRVLKPLMARDLVMGPFNRLASALYHLATRRAGLDSPLNPRLDKEALDFAAHNMLLDNRLLKSLGFEYRYPMFEEGWVATHDWYERNHWIPAA